MTKEKSNQSFIKDLIEVQKEIQTLCKDEKNPFFKSNYVPLSSILKEVKPVLNKHGFLLVQKPCLQDGQETLVTKIIHVSGESIECAAPLKMEERDKSNPQKFGSAITYMRRYTLTSLLALAEEDDDGNRASSSKPFQQVRTLNDSEFSIVSDLLDTIFAEHQDKSAFKSKKEFCDLYNIPSLREMPFPKYETTCNKLRKIIKDNGNN